MHKLFVKGFVLVCYSYEITIFWTLSVTRFFKNNTVLGSLICCFP